MHPLFVIDEGRVGPVGAAALLAKPRLQVVVDRSRVDLEGVEAGESLLAKRAEEAFFCEKKIW